jgi:hypothetical protein
MRVGLGEFALLHQINYGLFCAITLIRIDCIRLLEKPYHNSLQLVDNLTLVTELHVQNTINGFIDQQQLERAAFLSLEYDGGVCLGQQVALEFFLLGHCFLMVNDYFGQVVLIKPHLNVR